MKITKMITMAVAAVAMLCMVGCDKLPTPEKMKTISTVIGRTAGYACELSKTKQEVKDAIMNVLDIVSTVVPTNGQTFTEAWTPVINDELQKLVEKGKIAQNDVAIVKIALTAATEGIDYVFVKYPKAKDVKELVSVASEGFVSGYKSVVTLAGAKGEVDIDEDAYKYIKTKLIASK